MASSGDDEHTDVESSSSGEEGQGGMHAEDPVIYITESDEEEQWEDMEDMEDMEDEEDNGMEEVYLLHCSGCRRQISQRGCKCSLIADGRPLYSTDLLTTSIEDRGRELPRRRRRSRVQNREMEMVSCREHLTFPRPALRLRAGPRVHEACLCSIRNVRCASSSCRVLLGETPTLPAMHTTRVCRPALPLAH